MNFLFLFMDGVGLGDEDAEYNPLAKAHMPNLTRLLDGKRLVSRSVPLESERATLVALDPNLGMSGLPQSATGQASLVTGKNVPQLIGEHYGPKPTKEIAAIIRGENIFSELEGRGYRARLLNAYPERYFQAIQSGRRLLSAIPLSAHSADVALMTHTDLDAGRAFSADFTGQGWRQQLGYKDAPLMTHTDAGRKLAEVSASLDFAFFEYWMSDYVGHHQDMPGAIGLLEDFDQVFGGLLEAWQDDAGLILITSDHGNMEDMRTRRHTDNPVPGLVIGAKALRDRFCRDLRSLTDIYPAILQFYP
jgi:hypothetical protein